MAITPSGFGSTEMLQIIDSVSQAKGIKVEAIIEAMEDAIRIAGRRKYGQFEIAAKIDRETGEVHLSRMWEIVEYVEEPNTQISLPDAKEHDPDAILGGFIYDPLPPIDLGRVAAQTAKQIIVQRVREEERKKQIEDYKDRVGDIISGAVKRFEYGDIILELGSAEAALPKVGQITTEKFHIGDRVRAYIEDVRAESKGPQIFLSRAHPMFMAKLFAQEVPELYDGVIKVMAVARDPGSRAKIAVFTNDSNIDPVGSCVGVRGSRVQAVINELQGEKIDIIEWSSDPASLVVNALAPAEVSKVVIDEDKKRIAVVVPDDQLSLAIGRRGQNVRLASQLLGWGIDVMTEDDESKRRVEEFNKHTQLFTDALNVEEVMAQLLATEGFTSIEEVAYVPVEEIAGIEGFDEDIATELHNRANDYLEQRSKAEQDELKDLGVKDNLRNVSPLLTPEILIKLAKHDIKTLDNFADLSREEFTDIVGKSDLTSKQIDELIMTARSGWFTKEQNVQKRK